MQVSQAVEEYRYAILHLAPKTQGWYMEKLVLFADWCQQEGIELEKIKASDVRRFIYDFSKKPGIKSKTVSTYTVHGYAQVIKTFLNWCTREEGLEDLVSERLTRRIEMPRVEMKVIETFSPDQIQSLFAACEKEFTKALEMRDQAILSVLLDTGIRAGELCGLTLDCVFLTPEEAFIKVYGKGKKWREVGLGKEARTVLHRYITRYRSAPNEEQHVFLSRFTKPLTPNGLLQLFQRLGEWGQLKGVRCSPHTARHTFACSYLQAGGDLFMLSRLLGHTSIHISTQYLRAVKATDVRKHGPSVLDQMKPDTGRGIKRHTPRR